MSNALTIVLRKMMRLKVHQDPQVQEPPTEILE